MKVGLFINKLSQREKRLFFLCLLLLIFTFWYSYLLMPLLSTWREVNRESGHKELIYQKFVKVISKENTAQQSFEQLIAQLKIRGSQEEEMAAFLKEIESLARDKISITNIRPTSVKDYDFYKEFNVEVDCEAQIESLTKFIYDAEKSRSLLRVHRLRLQTKSGGPNLIQCSLQLSKILML